jgi:hypothetical protein
LAAAKLVGAGGQQAPPITKVGSIPPRDTLAASEVVVLPCVPAMAMPRLKRISSFNISARGTTGMRSARAAISSGFCGLIALEMTTTSAPPTLDAAWPRNTVAPMSASRRVTADSFWSEPETW